VHRPVQSMTVYILFICLRTGTGKTDCYEKDNETSGSKKWHWI